MLILVGVTVTVAINGGLFEKTKEGDNVFLTATDDSDSQNTAVYNILKNTINSIDGIVNTSGLKQTDQELTAKAILTEVNTNRLQLSGFSDLYINDANDLNLRMFLQQLSFYNSCCFFL